MEALPTKAQIAAIEDREALSEIKDAVDLAIVHIEAQLEFSDRDEAWAHTAINALALHRHVERMLHRRIEALAKPAPRASGAPSASTPPDRRPLTLEVLREPPQIDLAALATVEDVDAWATWLTDAINDVSSDREDEIARPASRRDERFMAATGRVLRQMRGLRIQVQTRRGAISKAATAARHTAHQTAREQLFIDAARQMLDPATYHALWSRVDAQLGREAAA